MKLIDLTHTVKDGLSVYPGDSPVKLSQLKKLSQDGYSNFLLETGMHAGTHIDGPMHLTISNTYIGEFPLESFTGDAIVIDVRDLKTIGINNEVRRRTEPGDIVLFCSGWDKLFGKEEYFTDYPMLDESLVQYLIEKKVKMIGLDWSSPDHEPYPMHQILLEHNILILENLTNLDLLVDEPVFEIIAFPLKINADSSLVRVVARIS
jgi:kynurenine formamidase